MRTANTANLTLGRETFHSASSYLFPQYIPAPSLGDSPTTPVDAFKPLFLREKRLFHAANQECKRPRAACL